MSVEGRHEHAFVVVDRGVEPGTRGAGRYEVDQTGRHTRLGEQLPYAKGGERGLAGRLDDDSVPRPEGRGQLAGFRRFRARRDNMFRPSTRAENAIAA